jgi:hypothetical protein
MEPDRRFNAVYKRNQVEEAIAAALQQLTESPRQTCAFG